MLHPVVHPRKPYLFKIVQPLADALQSMSLKPLRVAETLLFSQLSGSWAPG